MIEFIMNKKRLMSVADVAEELGYSLTTIRAWARRDLFPGAFPMPYGENRVQWFFTEESVQSFIERYKTNESEPGEPETA